MLTSTTTNKLSLSAIVRLALSNNDTFYATFTKKDGEHTNRKITGDPVLIKKLGGVLPMGVRNTAQGYICAFDVDKAGWILISEDSIQGVCSYSKKTEGMIV